MRTGSFDPVLFCLHGAFAAEHVLDGFEDDAAVQADGPVLDILGVEADDLFKIGDVAAAADLPHAGDAGAEGQAGTVVVLVLLPLVDGGRTRADDAHVALQDVPELGELVQGVLADEFADAGLLCPVGEDLVADDAGVKIQLEHHAVRYPVLSKELFLALVRVHVHGADFVELEALAVLADALLLVDDGAGRLAFDDGTDDEHDEQGDEAAEDPAEDVHEPLDEELKRGGIVGGISDDVEAVHLLHDGLFAQAAERNPDMDWEGHQAALFQEFGRRVLWDLPGRREMPAGGCHLIYAGAVIQRAVDEVLDIRVFIFLDFKFRHSGGIEEDLIHPLAADIVGGIVGVRHDRQAADGLALGIPVRQDKAGEAGFVQPLAAGEDGLDIRLVRNQDHLSLLLLRQAAADDALPGEAEEIREEEIEDRGKEDRHTAEVAGNLHREEDHKEDRVEHGSLLEGLAQLDGIAAAHHIMQRVEHHHDERIQTQKEKQDTDVVFRLKKHRRVGIDQAGEKERQEEGEEIEQDKVQMLGPAEAAALVQGRLSTFLSESEKVLKDIQKNTLMPEQHQSVIISYSGRFEEQAQDGFLQALFVRVEFDIPFPFACFARGGHNSLIFLVIQTLSKLCKLLRNEVGNRVVGQGVGHLQGKAAFILQGRAHFGIQRIQIDTLAVHTAEVGAVRHIQTVADEMHNLFPVQGDIGALDESRVGRSQVFVDMHGHTADHVVQYGNGVHSDGIIVVDGDIVQKAGHRLDAVAAAVLSAGAVGVGQGKLLKDGSGFLTADAEAANLAHGVAVQLQCRPRACRFVLDHQEEDVRLQVVEEVALYKSRGIVRELVDAEKQTGLEPVAQAVPAAVIIELQRLDGSGLGGGNGLRLAGLFPFFEIRDRKQPSADHRDEDHGDQQSPACVIFVSVQGSLSLGSRDDLRDGAEDGGLVQNEGDRAVIVHDGVELDPLAVDKHHQADKVVGILNGDGDGGGIRGGNSAEGLAGDNKRAVFGRGFDVGRDSGVFVLGKCVFRGNEAVNELFEVSLHSSVGIAGQLAESDSAFFGSGVRNCLDSGGFGPRGVSLGGCLRVCLGGIADPVSAAGVLCGARCRKGERRDAGEHQDYEQS